MVLLRSLLAAGAATASPAISTRQIFVAQWRSSARREYFANSWILAARERNIVAQRFTEAYKKRGQQVAETLKCSLRRNFDICRKGRRGEKVSHRVQCQSTFASSKELSISFPVSVDEATTVDSNLEALLKQLEIDGPSAVKLAVEELELEKETETVELSLLLCDDGYMQKLNKEWLGKDSPTDVLSFPQDQAPGMTPILLLGDVIISLETAAKQAEERGHSLLDELRILLVHGLLHVIGFDHELGPDDSQEMEDKETQILSKLGWKGKGLISAVSNSVMEESNGSTTSGGRSLDGKIRRPPKAGFKILFCDMDGTLLNSKSRISDATRDALNAVLAKGVQVIIATGKTRHGAMAALDPVGLVGENGVISLKHPGVFTQGLQVYGRGGSVIHSAVLDPEVVQEALTYSLEKSIPSVGFSDNRIVTLFRHSLTDVLHTVYLEPKAEVIPSLRDLMESCPIQKLLFYSTPEDIKYKIRPYWAENVRGRATLVQALDDMLEILPPGQSKGAGVKLLLDNLGVHPEEIMAIGDGENDIEMLELAGWGVAMANGSKRTKEVADAQTSSNDEDGAAEAFHRYILS
ncbi:probable rRNA maturation factor [Marchantia polymorpha subsp. ruderalis]|uniref:Uncharacterized protein n=2 Tax=Marchantia polymorpha TaxID=3197 RepID=A0AAF6BEC3_MARPO|nr:hypothetical protein MARPO_0124s0034 [Marchantia polymorpha]BBN10357.1 hypothetical protein Mp_5g02890 [Marchantia polymorpha subsp. ruderalis]|eukprot:PTQ30461.1 hypothetical protein MARPO_0124s0034 [Marchantia polymorpha]